MQVLARKVCGRQGIMLCRQAVCKVCGRQGIMLCRQAVCPLMIKSNKLFKLLTNGSCICNCDGVTVWAQIFVLRGITDVHRGVVLPMFIEVQANNAMSRLHDVSLWMAAGALGRMGVCVGNVYTFLEAAAVLATRLDDCGFYHPYINPILIIGSLSGV